MEAGQNKKMNRIILIGNGFDLAHGLKTSYGDFINNFWEKQLKELTSKWTSNKKGVSSKYEKTRFKYENDLFVLEADRLDIKQLEIENIKLSSEDKTRKIKENIKIMKSFIVSYKNKFLEKIEKEHTIKNWVDIEDLYFRQLVDCKNRLGKENYNIYTVQQLNKDFRFIRDNLKKYLTDVEEKRDDNEDFKKFPQGDLKQKMVEKSCSNEEIDEILLLNFNYLNTENLYKEKIEKENKSIKITSIHIHGNIKDTDDTMIFGYGDEMSGESEAMINLNDNDFLENVKSIKYVESLSYQELLAFVPTGKDKENTSSNEGADSLKEYEVFVMGHSCGNSDRTLLNYLFQNKKCKRIKVFYYEQYDGSDNYKEITTNIYRDFELDKKADYRDKVCPPSYAIKEEKHKAKVTSEPLLQYKDKKENFKEVVKKWQMEPLKKEFYIGKFLVTQKQWQEVMGYNDSWFQKNGDGTSKIKKLKDNEIENLPVENVSWYDAVLFCNMLSEKCKLSKYYEINGDNVDKNEKANGFRLPTEGEWEYAANYCRVDGIRTNEFAGCERGEDLEDYAWYAENSRGTSHPVGTAPKASELKIHDMSGNLWEWCWDKRDESSADRVLRGGGWYSDAEYCRVSSRDCNSPDFRLIDIGFRLVLPQ